MKETFLEKNFHEKMKMEKRGQETFRKSFNKRGQVTMFIILGILIVIIAGALLFVNRDKITSRGISNVQIEPVRTYIRDCAFNIVKEDLNEIRKNGGFLNKGNDFVGCGEVDFRVISESGVNSARLNMESFFESYFEAKFLAECNLDIFRDQFNIIENGMDLDVSFGEQSVSFVLDYNSILARGVSSSRIGKVAFIVKDDINEVNEIAKYIGGEYSNGEDTQDVVDKVNDGIQLVSINMNTRQILGKGCSNVGRCIMKCNGILDDYCCTINNKFSEENDLQPFEFALRR